MRLHVKKNTVRDLPFHIFIMCLIGVLVLAIPVTRAFFVSSGHRVIRPFASLRGYSLSLETSFSSYFVSHAHLARENEQLKQTLAERDLAMLSLVSLQKENEMLKSSLGRTTSLKTILATITARPPKTPYDVLSVDVGYQDGVRQGAKVFSRGVLLGEVSASYNAYSDITLYSTPDQRIDAVLSDSSTHIMLEGVGGGSFVFDIPRELTVPSGTNIIAQNLSIYPIATVVGEKTSHREALIKILAKSPVNVQSIRFVEIEKK